MADQIAEASIKAVVSTMALSEFVQAVCGATVLKSRHKLAQLYLWFGLYAHWSKEQGLARGCISKEKKAIKCSGPALL